VIHAFELPFETVGLAMPIAGLAGLCPGFLPPLALAKPSGKPAQHQPDGEGSQKEQEKRRFKREAWLRTPERIEDEEHVLAIGNGKRDEDDA
jgi:hypothetical protein